MFPDEVETDGVVPDPGKAEQPGARYIARP
jgi:hypothetical protein